MDFVAVVDQVIALLRQRGRVAYRTLKVQFHLDDDALEALKDELLYAHQVARDEDERIIVWTGDAGPPPADPAAPAEPPARVPLVYTPPYLAEKILTSRSALEGERKQVTVLFADLKGSLELLADRDPEEARQLLDPVLERMMAAVHRYEGTVNQVMGDGIMALFGAPLAHEDHAIRACYAALRMQESVMQYSEEMQRSHGVPVQIRVGLNSGEVVVRAIDSDLHMDYTAVGQTTHLAAWMEQMARPGSVLVTAATLQLAEGYIQVKPLGPIPIRGLADPLEVCELLGAGPTRTYLQAFAARGLTRFVGRQAEFEALRQALERAGAGHGQVVAVMEEPGVGKTRLFYEFIRSHRTRGWLVLESRSVSWGKATAYLPLSDLLKLYFQVEERDEARTIREKVAGKLVTLDTALGPTLPAFLTLLDIPVEEASWQALDPPQRRQRTLEAMKRLVLRESQVQPLHQFRGEPHLTQARAEAAVTLSTEQGLVYWCAEGTILRGWALAAQGQSVEGIAQMCQGLATHQATGAELVRPYLLPLLAETYAQGGRVDEGLRVLDQALVSVHTTGERWWEAELHRLKGELLLALSAEKYAEAETCFHQALDSARRQEAKALELRAARSLARLWQQQGRRAEAQALLAPIYGWFTEGFDTADLQEAKALLAELEGEHGRG